MKPLKLNSLTLLFSLLFFPLISCTSSSQETSKNTGVLVLAHGSRDTTWNQTIFDVVDPIRSEYPVEVAFGMANPYTMQAGIDSLESQGVDRIVVVPLFVSSYSPIIRQNEFLLGFRDTLADKPMMMMHGMPGASHVNMHKKDSLTHLDIQAEVLLTNPLDSHPLVADILMDRINAVSMTPGEETILLVAHGPVSDEDNNNWLKAIDHLADQINTKQAEADKPPFFKIVAHTVRDDADKEVYNQAKQEFRQLVLDADEHGEAIVIPLLLSKGGVESRYLNRLEGLNYTWGGETLLPHDNITEFIRVSIKGALEK